jgi:hypothetical protein
MTLVQWQPYCMQLIFSLKEKQLSHDDAVEWLFLFALTLKFCDTSKEIFK